MDLSSRHPEGQSWAEAGLHYFMRCCVKNTQRGTRKMSQWVKTLVTMYDDLSSVPETHIVEGDDRLPQAAF